LKEEQIEADSIAEVLQALDALYPGFSSYIVDESGALRKHVNIFIGNDIIEDKQKLGDKVNASDEVYIMQALSGG
jgi:molybdopterin converting factor small subunit